VKRVTHPMLGFKAFEAAQPILVGIARMPMLQKRPWEGSAEQGLPAAEQFYALAAQSFPDRFSYTSSQNLRQSLASMPHRIRRPDVWQEPSLSSPVVR
jgi:hypothetical protein